MNTFHQTDTFSHWLENLRDIQARARIVARIKSAELGNLGDCASVGEGVSEMRLHFGPGYRLYFWKRESQVYWLLAGGNKSTQQRDIQRAKALQREVEELIYGQGNEI
ncbi:MAG: type II toxin-antitoxin system RelE/ParE family toxin [Spartobacteria bacterium]|nr:type II toxin-antitoxin system RelE/ParE family toxin [Spartobacteria bacterium]